MQRAIATGSLALLLLGAAGCRSTSGKVLGPVAIASAIAGNGLMWTSEVPTGGQLDARSGAGLALISLSTFALFAWVAIESMHERGGNYTSPSGDDDGASGSGWYRSGGNGSAAGASTDPAAAPGAEPGTCDEACKRDTTGRILPRP